MIGSRSEFLTLRGLRLHLRRWGADDAPPLLLLHGFLDVSATFAAFAAPLAERFQVIAPDLRGFGLSGWAPGGYWFPDYLADVDGLLDHIAAQRAVPIVGHSLGAQIVAAYAGARPQRVSHLVCLDGPIPIHSDADTTLKRLRLWLDQQRQLDDEPVDYASFDAFARRLCKLHPSLSTEQSLFVARAWGQETDTGRVRLRADPRHRHAFAIRYRADDYERLWQEVDAPALFVDGAASTFMQSLGEARREAQLAHFRDHRRVVIPGAGHMLHLDRPAETAAAVLAFLSG